MKATFSNPTSGSDFDINQCAELLVAGESYDVESVDQYSWYTDVYLKGFGDISFNSVMFDYTDQEEFERQCAESFKKNYRLGD